MSKQTVTRLFIGAGLAIISGALLALAAIGLAVANDVFILNGPDIVGLRGSALAWSLIGVGIVGAVVVTAGLVAGVASWIGALLNTWRLESKAWFVGLLLLGIFNLGFFAMIAYLIGGPDGTAERPPQTTQVPAGA